MADESHVVRGVNWRESFPFTQIFRAFRVAIHPTKLILALVALMAIYAGGWLLDSIWPVQSRAIPEVVVDGKVQVPAEINMFERFEPEIDLDTFESRRSALRKKLEGEYAGELQAKKIVTDPAAARLAAEGGNQLGKLKDKLIEERNQAAKDLLDAKDKAITAIKDGFDKEGKNLADDKKAEAIKHRDDAIKREEDNYKKRVVQEYNKARDRYDEYSIIKGEGIFHQFFNYEKGQINNISRAVLTNDWLGGFSGNDIARRGAGGGAGVLKSIQNFCVTGPWWMVKNHTTYFILFVILFSIIWAIFGGAISRIAAVHVARDEKLSLSAALKFSTSKFLSFIFAPIIPLVIVVVLGIVVTIGGLLGNIPVIGPVIMGIFFFLALAAGFVMTLVLLGTGGGFNLMYPTIAVEGSDSFDAISRSFSYVYARPWRMLFYTLVSIFYGALCYLFVRYFLGIMLLLTHHFVGAGMLTNIDGDKVPIDVWNTMWPTPGGQFTYDIDTMTLGPAQTFGAFLISIWVYLAVGMLGAFFISFYFSANTIIYYLMRREVDATELDDVYLEQSEEDFGDTTPAPIAPATTTAVETPPTPPAT